MSLHAPCSACDHVGFTDFIVCSSSHSIKALWQPAYSVICPVCNGVAAVAQPSCFAFRSALSCCNQGDRLRLCVIYSAPLRMQKCRSLMAMTACWLAMA